MRLRDEQFDVCPKCGRKTLLPEVSPRGQHVCVRCGVVKMLVEKTARTL